MATDAVQLGKARSGDKPKEQDATAKQGQPALQRVWREPEGIWGGLTTVQSIRNGQRLIAVAFIFLLLGGINAALMRIQLAQPNSTFVTPEQYNQLFTMHGSTMIFLFTVPLMVGAAILLLPLVLGARAVPWPRLTAFVFWTFTIAGLLFESSWLLGIVPDAGWTAYAPLTEKAFSPNPGLDSWLLMLMMISIGGILASVLLITTVLKSRAPGMSIGRMPLFAWAVLTTGFIMFFAFIVLFCGSAFLEFDRKIGTHFYDPSGGGSPLLWQYLFWAFGNPSVYFQLIPAAGIASMVLPVIIRQRMIGHNWLALAFVLTGFVSYGLWADHMLVTGLSPLTTTLFTVASLVFAVLAAIQVSAWIATLWRGVAKWNTPYLFILGFLILFILGGITGTMFALYPFNAQAHDSYFVVAHLHYFLFGTVVFPMFAGIYYWFPKFKGKLLDERLGQWNFWLMFAGFNVAFFPMFISGLLGMPRRLYTYPSSPELDLLNLISTTGAIILVSGVLVFLYNLMMTLMGDNQAAENPWDADSLEWATDSPVPDYGFHHIPIVQDRYPLWDQKRLDVGNEKTVRLVERLAEWPDTWRAALLTSTLTAEPQEVYRVAGPSVWPLVVVVGMTLLFVSFFFDQLIFIAVFLLGTIVLIAGLIGWHRPAEEEFSIPPAELDAFEKTYGIPIYPDGSPTLNLWAFILTILGFAVSLAVMVFCYLTYRSNSPVWPPDSMARPDRYVPLIATAVLVISELSLLLGMRAARRIASDGHKRNGILRLALGVAFLLGIVFLVVQVRSYVLPPLTPTTDAYGSIFYSIGILMTIIAVIGLGILFGAQWSTWHGHTAGRHAQMVRNSAVYWSFVLVAWLVILATLYLAS